MNLQKHPAPIFAAFENVLNADHGYFDHVGCATLNGGVDGRSLCVTANGGICGIDIPKIAPPSGEGFDKAGTLGLFHGRIHIALHSGILFEVGVNNLTCIGSGNSEPLSEAKGGDPVNDAEVDHFCGTTHRGLYLFEADPIHSGGGRRVNINFLLEGFDHSWIPGHGSHDAKLDL